MLQDELKHDDWSLIAAALGNFGGPPYRTDDDSKRCYELLEAIALYKGTKPTDFVR